MSVPVRSSSPMPVVPDALALHPIPGTVGFLTDAELGAFADAAFAWLAGDSAALGDGLAGKFAGRHDPVYVSLRRRGRRVHESWVDPGERTAAEALAEHLRGPLVLEEGVNAGEVDGIELCLTRDWETVDMGDPKARQALLANIHRGVRGFAFAHEDHEQRVAPTRVIAQNRNHAKWLENFRQQRRLTEKDFLTQATTRSFEADQLWLRRPVEGDAVGHLMFRGDTTIPQSALSRTFVQDLEKVLGDFLFKALLPDGRMTYMYYPSLGREDTKRNNMIRQWMATVALSRTARYRGQDKKLFKRAEDNIRYNLRKFYHASGKLGAIEWQGKVKLGAVALAVLSILEHPNRKQFKRVESKLWNMIDHLWREDGSFVTFFKPAGRNDVQNFYPGEAQLAWAFLYEENKDAALLEKFMKSMRYYRDWHLQNRNPAFVPWHVQAYYKVWRITGEDELKDWVFDMSDWLLGMAQWKHNVVYDDTLGRFHDPANTRYGPPHASATGVYLEGLIDAFELAREVGDDERREKYRLAIIRGLRSVMQVMFKSDVDMYYVAEDKREWLRGGVRNTVYDNIVRIDNIQHNQMGIIKILAAFEDDDFLRGE